MHNTTLNCIENVHVKKCISKQRVQEKKRAFGKESKILYASTFCTRKNTKENEKCRKRKKKATATRINRFEERKGQRQKRFEFVNEEEMAWHAFAYKRILFAYYV